MQKSFPPFSPLLYPPFISLSLYPPSFFYLDVIEITSSNTFFPQFPFFCVPSPLFFFFVLLVCSFGSMSKQKCFHHKSSLRSRKFPRTRTFSWLLYIKISLFLTPSSSLYLSLSLLSPLSSRSLCQLSFFTPCLSSSLHPSLPSVTHLSLPFTNQYAGQQAVWQIVCCELHEKPLSIISVHYWIQSVVFSRVKWKDQGVQNVRRGESERRPAVHFSLSVTAQLQDGCNRSIVVLDVFTIRDNSADHRYCAQKKSCMKPTSNHRPSGMQRTDFSSIWTTFVSHTRIIDNTVTSCGVANTGASIVSIIFYIKTPQTCTGSLPLAVSSRADVYIEVSRHPSFRFLPPHHWNKHWINRLQLFSPELHSTEHIVPLQLIPSPHDTLHILCPRLQLFYTLALYLDVSVYTCVGICPQLQCKPLGQLRLWGWCCYLKCETIATER